MMSFKNENKMLLTPGGEFVVLSVLCSIVVVFVV